MYILQKKNQFLSKCKKLDIIYHLDSGLPKHSNQDSNYLYKIRSCSRRFTGLVHGHRVCGPVWTTGHIFPPQAFRGKKVSLTDKVLQQIEVYKYFYICLTQRPIEKHVSVLVSCKVYLNISYLHNLICTDSQA